MNTITTAISGYDLAEFSGVAAYYAGDNARTLSAADYNWKDALILTFDKNGRLYEAGSNVIPNFNERNGAQIKVTVPAGGFMLAFHSNSELMKAFNACFDGIMLYDSTCSMTYDMTAFIDRDKNTVTVNVGDPIPVTDMTVKFLFIGNSGTYFNGNPIKFDALCRAAGLDVKSIYCTFGSARLWQFADENHDYGKYMRQKLAADKYDYIVLQDATGAPYESSRDAIKTILPLIKANGATPLLYMRYANTIEKSQLFNKIYTALSDDFGIKTCTTALAYAYCMEHHPEINILADDGNHHSREGSYLAACTWLYCYMGVDPRGNTYTAGLPADIAAILQECAYMVQREYDLSRR